jgi:hypothetical protein
VASTQQRSNPQRLILESPHARPNKTPSIQLTGGRVQVRQSFSGKLNKDYLFIIIIFFFFIYVADYRLTRNTARKSKTDDSGLFNDPASKSGRGNKRSSPQLRPAVTPDAARQQEHGAARDRLGASQPPSVAWGRLSASPREPGVETLNGLSAGSSVSSGRCQTSEPSSQINHWHPPTASYLAIRAHIKTPRMCLDGHLLVTSSSRTEV